jgi:16S rRNA C967 or C1407 C5-methylase (RsmB/RsmF family)
MSNTSVFAEGSASTLDSTHIPSLDEQYEILHAVLPRFIRVIHRERSLVGEEQVRKSAEADLKHHSYPLSDGTCPSNPAPGIDIDDAIQTFIGAYTTASTDIRSSIASVEAADSNVLAHSTPDTAYSNPQVFRVKWMSDFIAISGDSPLPTVHNEDGGGVLSLGFYPMDVASAVAVHALRLGGDPRLPFQAHNALDTLTGVSDSSHSREARVSTVLDMCCCPGAKFSMITDEIVKQRQQGVYETETEREREGLLVGVDVSGSRIEVCRSLLRKVFQAKVKHAFTTLPVVMGAEEVNAVRRASGGLQVRQQIYQADGSSFCYRECINPKNGAIKGNKNGNSPSCEDSEATQLGSATTLRYDSLVTELEAHACLDAHIRKQTAMRDSLVGAKRERPSDSPRPDVVTILRSNKSARDRERKQLAEIHRAGADGSGQRGLEPDRHDETSIAGLFDRVLVDAECSHTGSYRHMRYIEHEDQASLTTATDAPEQLSSTPAHQHRLKKPTTKKSFISSVHETRGGASNRDIGLFEHGELEVAATRIGDSSIGTGAGATLAQLQRDLILNGYKHLKPGGVMVYSTCSLERAQNEDVVLSLLRHPAASGARVLDPLPLPVEREPTSALALVSTGTVDRLPNPHDAILRSFVPAHSTYTSGFPVLSSELDAFLQLPLPLLAQTYLRFSSNERRLLSLLVCAYIANKSCIPMEFVNLNMPAHDVSARDSAIARCDSQYATASVGTAGLLSKRGGTSGLFLAAIQKPIIPGS